MARMIFVNLPVADLARSKRFFSALGFEFDARWEDDKGCCLVLEPDRVYAMLLKPEFFQSFTKRSLCDSQSTEALLAFSCESRDEVDELVAKALAHGGSETGIPAQYQDFVYGRSFYDPDGHHWEAMWMDTETAMQHCTADAN